MLNYPSIDSITGSLVKLGPAALIYKVDISRAFRFIYLFGVLRRFQHCAGHIMMGSWKGRGNQYIQFVRVLYCKLAEIVEMCKSWLSKTYCSKRQLQSLLGSLLYISKCVKPAHFFLNRMLALLRNNHQKGIYLGFYVAFNTVQVIS